VLSSEERFAKLQNALSFLDNIQILPVKPTICAPYGDDLTSLGFRRIDWAPFVWQGNEMLPKDHELFSSNKIFSIGLSSVLSCLQLELKAGDKVLDMCAAPGIKSLYLQLLHNRMLDMYVNDISHARLLRLRLLFEKFNVPLPTFTNQTGQSLMSKYPEAFFDAVIIDAPCSGEGNVLRGDAEALKSWSPAKVRRLADMQRKLLIVGNRLAKQDGQLLYATCTLNKHENEEALRKAKLELSYVQNTEIEYRKLKPLSGIRLLPSDQSIGFFVAKVK
jgi:16S rRNA C967 or C1407 C5-methylase (RsmB/RsmF family)